MSIKICDGKSGAVRGPGIIGRGARLLALIAASACASSYAQNANTIEVSGNWQMQDAEVVKAEALKQGWYRESSAKQPEEGREISKVSFEPKGWYKATVPGTVLTTLVNNKVYPEPLYDENNRPEKIPEDLCRKDWWYRATVNIPEDFKDKIVWLNFNGINYSAEVWVNGKRVGPIHGAFIRGIFDITKYDVKPGKETAIAVRISPQPTKGIPSEHTMGTTGGPCGGEGRLDGPTFGCSVGWDWQSGIRDRNSGIWQNVTISATGPAIIKDPYVTTDLPNLPKTDVATVSVEVPVRNVTDKPVKGTVKGSFGNVKFEKKIDIAPWHTATVKFTPEEYPQLKLENPKLWWPNGLGEPNLYRLSLSFEDEKAVSDTRELNFGIRKFEYFEPGNPNFALSVNGVRVFMKGGNWGMEEALKRIDRERLETQVRMHRDLNFNMIRNWGGQSTSDLLFELCDKYGIMLWDEFFQFNNADPVDTALYMANVRDKVLRYRNHPSVVLWCSRNEATPTKYLDDAVRYMLVETDPSRHYQSNSGGGYGFNSGGPYDWTPPVRLQRYFEDPRFNKRETFKTEIGGFSVPTLESIQGMFPKSEWDGITDSWAEHNFCAGGGRKYPRYAETRYGKLKNLADFVRKAQMMNYEMHKALYEGRLGRMFDPAQGVLYWMSIPSQPSFVWQLIQYDLEPNASFFGVKKACEPVHIFFSETDKGIVQAVNHNPAALQNARGRLTVYNFDGTVAARKDYKVDIPAVSAATLGKIEWPENLSRIHFVKLELEDSKGRLLSDNFYWRSLSASPEDVKTLSDDNKLVALEDFKDLENLPKVLLKSYAKVRSDKNSVHIDVTLTNDTPNVALMAHLQVQGRNSKKRILPVSYSDNYVSLAPKDSKTITVSIPKSALKNDKPVVMVDGWNVGVKDSQYIANNKNADPANWGDAGFTFKPREIVRKPAVRINCGGYNRGEFEKDPGFLEAPVGFQTENVDLTGAKNPGHPDMYRTVRWSNSTYTAYLSGKPGQKYTVRLHFAESSRDKTAGKREFDVKANGEYILKDYDVAREAGGVNKAVVAEIRDVKSDGDSKIVLEFVGGKKRANESRDPQVCGIEVIPQK